MTTRTSPAPRSCAACKRRVDGRRFRCTTCRGFFCVRCQNGGGSGWGANSTRWSECHGCMRQREAAGRYTDKK